MSKVIKITPWKIESVDLPENISVLDRLHWMYQQIGCKQIETVATYRFDERYMMVVDEEGKLRHSDVNPAASWLYGPGDIIVGTALLMKQTDTEDGPDLGGMDEEEARHIMDTIESLLYRGVKA